MADSDRIYIGGQQIEFVSQFCYLGIELSVTGTCFSHHVRERVSKGHKAAYAISNVSMLSLQTALSLFMISVLPVLSYGIRIAWRHLTAAQLLDMERVKASYIKRALGIPRTSSTRLAYKLAGCKYLAEELQLSLKLEQTDGYSQYMEEVHRKQEHINQMFYLTPAMTQTWWTEPLQPRRHHVTRFAVHGFHHKICVTPEWHAPCSDCICRHCLESCHETYHWE